MEYIDRHPLIIVLSGKAKSGKDLVANRIIEYYKDKKCIKVAFASYLKMYVQNITNWDGSEIDKPRDLLQSIGIDLIKNKIDANLLIRRVCEDIKVYSYFYDVIIVTDARMQDEIKTLKNNFDCYTIRINRSNVCDKLTKEQNNHITETDLDNYTNFDFVINNIDEDLNKILKEVDK